MSSHSKSSILGYLVSVIFGAVMTLALLKLQSNAKQQDDMATQNIQAKPVYWVAPMDANYRRDKPGKSPMGMDLIPYYGNENNTEYDEGVGHH